MSSEGKRPGQLAIRWLEAITRRDWSALTRCSHPDIRIHGPDGVGVGHEVMRMWFDTAPMAIAIRSLAERDQAVLVRHQIDWLGSEGQIEQTIENAALIETEDGRVVSYRRVEDPTELEECSRW